MRECLSGCSLKVKSMELKCGYDECHDNEEDQMFCVENHYSDDPHHDSIDADKIREYLMYLYKLKCK